MYPSNKYTDNTVEMSVIFIQINFEEKKDKKIAAIAMIEEANNITKPDKCSGSLIRKYTLNRKTPPPHSLVIAVKAGKRKLLESKNIF